MRQLSGIAKDIFNPTKKKRLRINLNVLLLCRICTQCLIGFFHISIKCILKHFHTWSLTPTPFNIETALQRKVYAILQSASVQPQWSLLSSEALLYKRVAELSINSSVLILLLIGNVITGFLHTLSSLFSQIFSWPIVSFWILPDLTTISNNFIFVVIIYPLLSRMNCLALTGNSNCQVLWCRRNPNNNFQLVSWNRHQVLNFFHISLVLHSSTPSNLVWRQKRILRWWWNQLGIIGA